MSRFKPLKYLFRVIVWIIRGVPLMLQLFVVFYLPGKFWNDLDNTFYFDYGMKNMGPLIAASIAFIINYACYFSEIYRGGIESIPKGQYEACQVLGMTKKQTFFRVVLLQVVKRIVPPMGNEIITLVKDTSLARTIAVYEIIWNAQKFIKNGGLLWPLIYAGAFYLIFNGLLTVIFSRIEKKMDYFKA
jgi:polar amino acid transport system permease protein